MKITKLNYNDLSFFKGITTKEAKLIIAKKLDIEIPKKGNPKVKLTDYIPVSDVDFTMKSNSDLEGKNQMEYLINHYKKGTTTAKLMEWSENKGFAKALKFTGKYSVLNEILNKEQLQKLQKTWLLKNCLYIKRSDWSKKAIFFIGNNDWSREFLKQNGINL